MKTTLRGLALAALVAAGGAAFVRPARPLLFRSPGQETSTPAPLGGTLRGRVLQSGAPVAGARVKLISQQSRTTVSVPLSRQAVTDSEGRFELAGVTDGPARLTVIPDRLAPSAVSLEVRDGAEVTVELVPGVAFEGVVMSGDAPVEGAFVALRLLGRDAEPLPFRETRSDSEGRFKLEGLDPAKAVRVAVLAESFRPFEKSVRTPGELPSRFDLDPGVRIGGRVVTSGGAPVAGARVEAGQGEGYVAGSTTESTGDVQVGGLISRPVALRVLVEGFAPARLDLSAPESGWTIVLHRNGGLAGRAPAGSFLVIEVGGATYRRRIGADGAFRWEGLPAGTAEAKAVDNKGRVLASRTVEIPEGAVAEGIQVQP